MKATKSPLNVNTVDLKNRLKKVIPEPLIVGRRKLNARLRRLKRNYRAEEITVERMVVDFENAGVRNGDILMVHSSLSKIGNVVDGPIGVIKSLTEVLSDKGTLLMPCYFNASDIIDRYRRGVTIDLRSERSTSGIISETFRIWRGVKQSSNPFSPVCAWGAKSRFVTSAHQVKPFVCHSDSPVGRLIELEGKVMGIGVSIAQGLGVAHCLEDTWDGFPFEVHSDVFPFSYIDADGETVERDVCRFDPSVSRTRIDQPYGAWLRRAFTDHFTRKGIMTHFKVGCADSWMMETRPLYDELKRLAEKNITMYLTPKACKSMGHARTEDW